MTNNGQATFFNRQENQYNEALIINPPLHTRYEIDHLLTPLNQLGGVITVVDFGAGSGRITIPLLNHNYRVTAVDISEKSLEKIGILAKKLHLKKLTISQSLPRTKISAIIGADILHHVDLDVYIPLFYQSLQKKGAVVFSEPNAWNLSWYLYLPIASSWNIEKGMMKMQYFQLEKKLQESGFVDIKISGLGLFPLPLFNWSKRLCLFNIKLGNLPLLKFFAYRFIVTATKK